MDEATEKKLRDIYERTKTIAVVGASTDPAKPSHTIPAYLQAQGYRIIPVSPKGGEILGEQVAQSLEQAGGPVDVVNVFRPSEETPGIARAAAGIGARVLWLQVGIESEEAEQIAREAGMEVVMNRCMGKTHEMLGLGPGPD